MRLQPAVLVLHIVMLMLLPFNGRSYYRLKQQDIDGNFKYSEVRFVDLNREKAITAYPNPVQDVLNINLGTYVFKHAVLRITDMSGRVLRQEVISGSGSVSFSAKNLSPGVYAADLTEDAVAVKFRFVKQ